MAETQVDVSANVVDRPIINSPFEEPTAYWHIPGPVERRRGRRPERREGRRPSGYYIRPRTRKSRAPETPSLFEEEFVALELVNRLREAVKQWRQDGYPGVTPVTRELLGHWHDEDREKRLFFCQLEAAETVIFLTEAPGNYRQGIEVPLDEPTDRTATQQGYRPLRRYACKMATGSGKTVVMAMLAAWSVLNKVANPRDTRFSDAVLAVCPNLTIKERLQVLKPWEEGNYYDEFDLVPSGLRANLDRGKFMVVNWQAMQVQDDERSRTVLNRGREGEAAFCRRVLRELGGKRNLLVINDEAHHAYRPPAPEEMQGKRLAREEEQLLQEATVWVGALDRINRARGIVMCLDFSATPFYISGSGHEEGEPFPWIVSDFSLPDAIECGIVKIPQLPVRDDQGNPEPKYKFLWDTIREQLSREERGTGRRAPSPEAVWREAQPALANLASDWKQEFDAWQKREKTVPPVLIVVCQTTDIAAVVHDRIAQGHVINELRNENGREVTLRIDSRLLDELEAGKLSGSKAEEAERLRKIVATVGREGQPGQQVRCVVSVGMLSEGWDAQNVTHILGVRAFTSQLLCEQVVGRGLRRTQYDRLDEPEYVKVYGVPFEVIPVREDVTGGGPVVEKPSVLVTALPERRKYKITFPRVDGYVVAAQFRVKCDLDALPLTAVGPSREPIRVTVQDAIGYLQEVDDRQEAWHQWRVQRLAFDAAAQLVAEMTPGGPDEVARRATLFPQVLKIVWQYIRQKVRKPKYVDWEELNLDRYRDHIVEILRYGITPADSPQDLLPVINRYRPTGSTEDVRFRTSRMVEPATKSHINYVVLDNVNWERAVVTHLEQSPAVIAYAKNDHLGLEIPYLHRKVKHLFRPDFIARMRRNTGGEVHVLVELKGYVREEDEVKKAAAMSWVEAVNNHGGFGRWAFIWCTDPDELPEQLADLAQR
ncbi:MAG: DEAD/DEAH box helicase family protein [Armatimonadetes bacterium]|nr:DEAD/DEAH box helicase family protein [Armatimonadota bacterium]